MFNLKRKLPQPQRSKAISFSDSSSDDEQTIIANKTRKFNSQVSQHQDDSISALIQEESQAKVETHEASTAPKYLDSLLQSSRQRKLDQLGVKKEMIAKSGGLVFESAAYKESLNLGPSTEDNSVTETPTDKPLPSNEVLEQTPNEPSSISIPTELINQVIKSKITDEELLRYKERYWKRHPERRECNV